MRESKSMSVAPKTFEGIKRRSQIAVPVQLTFFARAHSFGAAIALGEFFHATGRVHEFLFAGEKRMTSGANTDSNVTTRRAGLVDRAARADDICLMILWVNACSHRQK